MSFTLKLLFSGLCVFIPNEKTQQMRVMLIDARAPGVASNGRSHVSHIPAVRFRLADLVDSQSSKNKRANFFIHPGSEQSQLEGMWVLQGDDLKILVDGTELPDKELQFASDSKEFSLVPEMKQIYAEIGGIEVKDECFETNLTNDIGVVARLKLRAGTIGIYKGTSFASKDKFGKPHSYITDNKFKFVAADHQSINSVTHHQQLASCCYFETQITSDRVELFSLQQASSLMLMPGDGNLVEVMIENVPPLGIEMTRPSSDSVDIDFELIYNIAKNMPEHKRVPVRVKEDEAPRPELCCGAIYNATDKA